MKQDEPRRKPLYLSDAEAMALLDMCLTSVMELDPPREHALCRLTAFVRAYISEDARSEASPDEASSVTEIRTAGTGCRLSSIADLVTCLETPHPAEEAESPRGNLLRLCTNRAETLRGRRPGESGGAGRW